MQEPRAPFNFKNKKTEILILLWANSYYSTFLLLHPKDPSFLQVFLSLPSCKLWFNLALRERRVKRKKNWRRRRGKAETQTKARGAWKPVRTGRCWGKKQNTCSYFNFFKIPTLSTTCVFSFSSYYRGFYFCGGIG